MIGIVDYDMGNIGSIANMIQHLQGECCVVGDALSMLECDKLILPGVGAFDTAVQNLHQRDLWHPLLAFAQEQKKPVLGVCLGMQIMCAGSEEGATQGLGWFDTTVLKFDFDSLIDSSHLRVPHMGWNTVTMVDTQFPLFENWEAEMRFYFVHGYAVHDTTASFVKGITYYGYPFASVIGHQNIMGFQCHPEKSHRRQCRASPWHRQTRLCRDRSPRR